MSDRKIVVITGANRGIGLELARHYPSEGCDVIGVCRESSPELTEVAAKIVEGVDVTTESGIQKLTKELKGQSIDLLINNAGLLQDETLGSIDFDSIRTQMEINAYAPLRVAEALVRVREESRTALDAHVEVAGVDAQALGDVSPRPAPLPLGDHDVGRYAGATSQEEDDGDFGRRHSPLRENEHLLGSHVVVLRNAPEKVGFGISSAAPPLAGQRRGKDQEKKWEKAQHFPFPAHGCPLLRGLLTKSAGPVEN